MASTWCVTYGHHIYRGTAPCILPANSTSLWDVAASPYWAGSLWYGYVQRRRQSAVHYAKLARTGALCNLPSVNKIPSEVGLLLFQINLREAGKSSQKHQPISCHFYFSLAGPLISFDHCFLSCRSLEQAAEDKSPLTPQNTRFPRSKHPFL